MTTTHSNHAPLASRPLARLGIFIYAIFCYAIGMAAIGWLVARSGHFVPHGTGPIEASGPIAALAVDAGLLILFGVQHSVMARPSFKARWTRIVRPAAERSTYVLAAGIALGLLLWLWQPVGGAVWTVTSEPARVALWTLFGLGWLYLVVATFVTNHFDLFGLRQAWLHLRGEKYRPVPFVKKWMYRYSRHPMMAGILLGLWATPVMTGGHFVLALGLTAYVAVGIGFEERGLARAFGETYRRYQREVGVFWPRVRPRPAPERDPDRDPSADPAPARG